VPDISSPLASLREKRKGAQLSFRKLIVDRVEYITQDLLGQCKGRKAAALEARRTVAHELNMHERTLQNYLKQKDAITMRAGIDGTWILSSSFAYQGLTYPSFGTKPGEKTLISPT
jgi:hypothetical protein